MNVQVILCLFEWIGLWLGFTITLQLISYLFHYVHKCKGVLFNFFVTLLIQVIKFIEALIKWDTKVCFACFSFASALAICYLKKEYIIITMSISFSFSVYHLALKKKKSSPLLSNSPTTWPWSKVVHYIGNGVPFAMQLDLPTVL